jgi:RecA-family ATPase
MEQEEYLKTIRLATQKMNEEVDRQVREHNAAKEAQKGNYDDLRTLRGRGWLTKIPPNRKYLFNYREAFDSESGFLPAGKACMIASPGGCGKTFVLVHCALAAATGSDWLNTKATKPVKVLFVAAEEDEDELWNRFNKMAKGLGLEQNPQLMELALDNIIALPQRGRGQRLIDETGQPTKAYQDLQQTIENDKDIKLVILDPAARFMGTETETHNAAATDWVNLIDALTLLGGNPAILIAHHTNKTALRPVGNDKKPVFDQSMCRGASALVDGFRWVLGLQRSEGEGDNKSIFVKLMKTNYCKIGPMLEFEQDFENGGILKLKSTVKENNTITAKPIKESIRNYVDDREMIRAMTLTGVSETRNDW